MTAGLVHDTAQFLTGMALGTGAIGLIPTFDQIGLTAAIITAEARHCTVLADLAGVTDPSLRLVDAESDPVDATE